MNVDKIRSVTMCAQCESALIKLVNSLHFTKFIKLNSLQKFIYSISTITAFLHLLEEKHFVIVKHLC